MAFFNGTIRSDVLGMRTGVTLVLPFDVSSMSRQDFPVLYLLHGLSDDHTCWWRYTSVERYANERNMILVIPEVQRSFYTDMKYGLPYFTYVSDELPKKVERLIGITHRRNKTAVAGLSMGGYGALKCGFSRPDFFGYCAGFSSVTDSRRISCDFSLVPENQINGVFGSSVTPENDLLCLAENLAGLSREKRPQIYLTCGLDDFLYEDNRLLRSKLDNLKIDYTYEEWPGTHEWGFWDKSVEKAMNFFLSRMWHN